MEKIIVTFLKVFLFTFIGRQKWFKKEMRIKMWI